MEQLQHFFTNKPVRTLLDIGTGTGNFIAVLKKVFDKHVQILGVDPDEASLEEAAKIYPEATFKSMTGEKLDFADSTFDVASISMALHHLPNIQLTLKEMQRVVKPHGWIIVNELFSDNLNAAQEVHKKMHHFRSSIDRMNGVCHNETFTRKEIMEQIEASGLTISIAFDHDIELKSPSPAEISTRMQKLTEMLEQSSSHPDYEKMKIQLPEIELSLKKHGFQMATRVVVVSQVNK
ncbi:class I SAM-dependent methyltransferase [uncultured Draconibacterium sp.]|uniref:class I SAM-dependent methyltransferase n=1 Tax=uncultured Draconibacterium sp. TaxID=1573823 RepID=UPI0025DA6569|nr:class I SAM-dependent methyltransferase [uncultured Draconibacterium sp.]